MNKCIICNKTANDILYAGILQCHNCGYVFADIHITNDDLNAYYNNNYFSGKEYSNYEASRNIIQKNFKNRLKVLNRFISPSNHGNLLDIGCAYGFFLDCARSFFSSIKGIDITEEGTKFARERLNLDIITGDFIKHDFIDQKFDVVCMWDTIEHLKNPQLFLDKISTLVDSGGWLALTTGDIESLNARIRKDKWRHLKPPEHLHYFSKGTISKFLNNYGFDIIYNHYCGNYFNLDNITNKLLVLNHKSPSLYRLLNRLSLNNINFYLNMFDIMYVIARKR